MEQLVTLERVKPEQLGVLSKGILDFLSLIEDKQINLHSFMLLRHGKVAVEGYYRPFDDKLLHNIYSVSKSVTSAAIGIAIGEGLLTLEDRIVDFFPEKLSEPIHPYTAMMKVKHLLAMSTVHERSTDTKADDWVQSFLNTPPSHIPGTIFAYDTTGTHTLCAIIQKLTGLTLHEYLKPRMFDPIGMDEIEWESCPMNINKGGGGIKSTTEDLARFGQLYLQKGIWNGKRILPEGWVELSTARHIDNANANFLLDGKKGYGYQFWRSRNDSYCAFGMGGQFVVVIPEKDAVFISTANTLMHKDGHQLILDALWEALYPSLKDGLCEPDPIANEQLEQKLNRLALVLPKGEAVSPKGQQFTGKRFRLEPNKLGYDACKFTFTGSPLAQLSFFRDGEQTDLRFGLNKWIEAEEPFMGCRSANAGTWVDEKTCLIQLQIFDCLQMFVLTCHFDAEGHLVIHIVPAGAHRKEDSACYLNGSL